MQGNRKLGLSYALCIYFLYVHLFFAPLGRIRANSILPHQFIALSLGQSGQRRKRLEAERERENLIDESTDICHSLGQDVIVVGVGLD